MTLSIRRSQDRGHTDIGWLDSRHTFSFGDYHEPRAMGFRALRVVNEDRVAPGGGFPTHPHRDMEILSYVLEGALEHKDSLGTGSVIRPGELQRMTAGTGVLHSEKNASRGEPVHFLQIWLLPEAQRLAPGYEQKAFPREELSGKLRLVGARDGKDGAVTIHQDVGLYATMLAAGARASLPLRKGRHAWVQVARGSVRVNGEVLQAGDGAAISDEGQVELAGEGAAKSGEPAEVLVFDLA